MNALFLLYTTMDTPFEKPQGNKRSSRIEELSFGFEQDRNMSLELQLPDDKKMPLKEVRAVLRDLHGFRAT